jgi:hypothetical protein
MDDYLISYCKKIIDESKVLEYHLRAAMNTGASVGLWSTNEYVNRITVKPSQMFSLMEQRRDMTQ